VQPVHTAKTESARTDTFARLLNYWSDYYQSRKINPDFLFLYSFDFSTPIDWDDYMTTWNKEVKQNNPRGLPVIQYATSVTALKAVAASKSANIDQLTGERPNVWLYIHGPTHHKALTAGREGSRLLTAAEKFATMNAILQKSFSGYPAQELTDAWEAAIYPDHGWGGKNGHITDQYFREKFEFARTQGKEILCKSLESIASKIKFNGKQRYAITVFNQLSWERTDPVTVTLDASNRQNTHFKIIDASGKEITYQWTANHQYNTNREELLTFTFIAENVPSVGYKTYYIVENENPAEIFRTKTEGTIYENRFYRVTLGMGGITSLYDKELKMELFKTDKFCGGELFTMQSIGNGAGEFEDVQQPTMEGFDKSSNYPQAWQLIETGSVKDVLQLVCPMRHTKASIRIALFKDVKRIDFEVDLDAFNGENWREFRLAFPINMPNAKVTYEVPMGVVEVGKDEIAGAAGFSKPTQIYKTPCKEVHPREVQDWFSVSDGKAGITISSSVAVFDWIDPTDNPVTYPVLQPVLLASRKSCHREGNYYLQPGNHSFIFSLYSHQGDWKNGYRQGTQSYQPAHTTVVNTTHTEGYLPETLSFASVSGKGVVISAIKKCEDDDMVVLRCYDIEGKDMQTRFSLFHEIKKVQHTNMIEEEGKDLKSTSTSFEHKIGHHSIETFKLCIEN
jgi:alpha-mannosidase